MRAELGHDEPGGRLVTGGQKLVLNLGSRDPGGDQAAGIVGSSTLMIRSSGGAFGHGYVFKLRWPKLDTDRLDKLDPSFLQDRLNECHIITSVCATVVSLIPWHSADGQNLIGSKAKQN